MTCVYFFQSLNPSLALGSIYLLVLIAANDFLKPVERDMNWDNAKTLAYNIIRPDACECSQRLLASSLLTLAF